MFQTAHDRFGAPITTVVNNALVDFFNGDARLGAEPWVGEFRWTVHRQCPRRIKILFAAVPGMRERGRARHQHRYQSIPGPGGPYHDYTAAKAADR